MEERMLLSSSNDDDSLLEISSLNCCVGSDVLTGNPVGIDVTSTDDGTSGKIVVDAMDVDDNCIGMSLNDVDEDTITEVLTLQKQALGEATPSIEVKIDLTRLDAWFNSLLDVTDGFSVMQLDKCYSNILLHVMRFDGEIDRNPLLEILEECVKKI